MAKNGRNAQLKSKLTTITPKMATQWLEKNEKNRKPRKPLIDRISEDIVRGAWEITGEAIVFDSNGALIDGQHRLLACIQSGKPIQSMVVRGVAPRARIKMDTGEKRQAHDVLKMEGVGGTSSTTCMASAARTIMALQRLETEDPDYTSVHYIHGKGYVPSDTILNFVRKNEDEMIHCVDAVYKGDARLVARPPSLFAALYFHMRGKNEREADAFFGAFFSGEGLKRGDPTLTLRNRLVADMGDRNTYTKNSTRALWVAMAWNAHMRRIKLSRILVMDDAKWPKIRATATRKRAA